jgi:hypothetical protein
VNRITKERWGIYRQGVMFLVMVEGGGNMELSLICDKKY